MRLIDADALKAFDRGMYATCGKSYLGMVRPNDYCSKGKRKDGTEC